MKKEISIKEVLEKYPQNFNKTSNVKAILLDYFPQNLYEVNIVSLLYEARIPHQMKEKKIIDLSEIRKYCKIMAQLYGMNEESVFLAVSIWADAYDIELPNDLSIDHLSQTESKSKCSSNITWGEILWEDDNIVLVLEHLVIDINEQDITDGRVTMNLLAKNKKDEPIHIDISGLSICGKEVYSLMKLGDIRAYGGCVKEIVLNGTSLYMHKIVSIPRNAPLEFCCEYIIGNKDKVKTKKIIKILNNN